MIPGYIQVGTYAGSGVYFVGPEDRDGSPFECTVEITGNSRRFLISGYFRRSTETAKRQFSGSFNNLRHSLTKLTIDAIELRVAALGEFTGVLSNDGTSILIQASSDSGEIQISQRWDELLQKHCFSVHGVVIQPGMPPMHYSLTFGNVDPRLVKSNVLALDDSA